jgi:hypothetical protein
MKSLLKRGYFTPPVANRQYISTLKQEIYRPLYDLPELQDFKTKNEAVPEKIPT